MPNVVAPNEEVLQRGAICEVSAFITLLLKRRIFLLSKPFLIFIIHNPPNGAAHFDFKLVRFTD
jgi:hypothetical protein